MYEERYLQMNKVYIVWRLGFEGDSIAYIYKTEKKAEDKCGDLNDGKTEQAYVWTEENIDE